MLLEDGAGDVEVGQEADLGKREDDREGGREEGPGEDRRADPKPKR